MNIHDHISIVLDLASENVLDEVDALQDEEILVPMRNEQLAAIEAVTDHFHNMLEREKTEPAVTPYVLRPPRTMTEVSRDQLNRGLKTPKTFDPAI